VTVKLNIYTSNVTDLHHSTEYMVVLYFWLHNVVKCGICCEQVSLCVRLSVTFMSHT